MPLPPSDADDCVGRTINKLKEEGKSQLQAEAIAFDHCDAISESAKHHHPYNQETTQTTMSTEHSCRLNDPSEFDDFETKKVASKVDGKRIHFVFGIEENDSGVKAKRLQSVRFPIKDWGEDPSEAEAFCSDRWNELSFHVAEEDSS